jgi:hypothetical protein
LSQGVQVLLRHSVANLKRSAPHDRDVHFARGGPHTTFGNAELFGYPAVTHAFPAQLGDFVSVNLRSVVFSIVWLTFWIDFGGLILDLGVIHRIIPPFHCPIAVSESQIGLWRCFLGVRQLFQKYLKKLGGKHLPHLPTFKSPETPSLPSEHDLPSPKEALRVTKRPTESQGLFLRERNRFSHGIVSPLWLRNHLILLMF